MVVAEDDPANGARNSVTAPRIARLPRHDRTLPEKSISSASSVILADLAAWISPLVPSSLVQLHAAFTHDGARDTRSLLGESNLIIPGVRRSKLNRLHPDQ